MRQFRLVVQASHIHAFVDGGVLLELTLTSLTQGEGGATGTFGAFGLGNGLVRLRDSISIIERRHFTHSLGFHNLK